MVPLNLRWTTESTSLCSRHRNSCFRARQRSAANVDGFNQLGIEFFKKLAFRIDTRRAVVGAGFSRRGRTIVRLRGTGSNLKTCAYRRTRQAEAGTYSVDAV